MFRALYILKYSIETRTLIKMLPKQNLEQKIINPKYLVVDDLISPNSTYKKNFYTQMGLPLENVIFASNYEEANEIIKNTPNILICFVDCIIPKSNRKENVVELLERIKQKNNSEIIDNLKLAEWGIKIIAENQKVSMCIFSAHLDLRDLEELSKKYHNIIQFAEKPLDSTDFLAVKNKYIRPYFPEEKKKTANLSSLKPRTFDYSSVDNDLALFLMEKAQEIRRLTKRTTRDIINIGLYLIEVKAQLGHGNFLNWIDGEFGWGYTSSSRFMNVAHKFKFATVENLNIFPTALYELAAPSTPEPATEEVLGRARQGETITRKIVQEVKEKHQSSAKKSPKGREKQDFEVPSQLSKRDDEKRGMILPLRASSSENKQQTADKPQILSIQRNTIANSYWQLGEEHKLFCGEPKNPQFLKLLPNKVNLVVGLPPNNNKSLIPDLKTEYSFIFSSEYNEVEVELETIQNLIEKFVEEIILNHTDAQNNLVFCYIFAPQLLELADSLDCKCYIAESDLAKCSRILERWRKKGKVSRIKL